MGGFSPSLPSVFIYWPVEKCRNMKNVSEKGGKEEIVVTCEQIEEKRRIKRKQQKEKNEDARGLYPLRSTEVREWAVLPNSSDATS